MDPFFFFLSIGEKSSSRRWSKVGGRRRVYKTRPSAFIPLQGLDSSNGYGSRQRMDGSGGRVGVGMGFGLGRGIGRGVCVSWLGICTVCSVLFVPRGPTSS